MKAYFFLIFLTLTAFVAYLIWLKHLEKKENPNS